MTDSHPHLGSKHPYGEVKHADFLSEHFGALFLNDEYSDVTLLVKNTRFQAHKLILAARSEYFRALLYGGMKESQQSEIELKETSLPAFKILLKYIYSGCMTLENLKEDIISDVLGLAHQYGFVELEAAISDHLKTILNIGNAFMINEMANLFQLTPLSAVCCCYIYKNATLLMAHESFLSLSAPTLKKMIGIDSFSATEIDIFKAVCQWIKHNPDAECQDILSKIRLPLMKGPELMNIVRPTGLFSPDAILDAISTKIARKDTNLYKIVTSRAKPFDNKHGTLLFP